MHPAGGAPPPLALVVDARGIDQSGIGRYLREVLTGILGDPRFRSVRLLGPSPAVSAFLGRHGKPAHVSVEHFEHAFYSPRAQLDWLRMRDRAFGGADVAFFPHYDAPLFALPIPAVVTVHDLTQFLVPGFPAWKRALGGILIRRAVAGASRVLTGSEATRADLVGRFPWAAPRTLVIPYGVNVPGSAGAAGCPVDGPFLLCVGNRKPHKNLAAAVEVLERLLPRFPRLRLVLVGRSFPGDGVGEMVRARGVAEAVLELGEVTDEELHALYSSAECLLFPSLYEGFGLPVLEAMAHGAPVVASNRSSVPEVAGDAALLVDPEDVPAFASAVERVLTDAALRESLSERGRLRAAAFSWRETSARTADVLYAVAREGPGQR